MVLIRPFIGYLLTLTALGRPGGGWNEGHPNCLCDEDASDIVSRWVTLHTTDPTTPAYASLAASTLSEDITVEDETVNFFFFPTMAAGPYVTNSTTFIIFQAVAYEGSQTGTPTISPEIPILHDCDTITFRWIWSATVDKVLAARCGI